MNLLLLPKSAFFADFAHIENKAQIAHIRRILRASVGDSLKIGQIFGNTGYGIIDTMDDMGVWLKQCVLTTPPAPKLSLTMVLALPRPKVLRRLIMDMTAAGVGHIVLIASQKSQKSYWDSAKMQQIDDYVFEGLQQGFDTHLPKITICKYFRPFVEEVLSSMRAQKYVLHPYACAPCSSIDARHESVVIVGAEGGFVDFEIELLIKHGVQAVNFGARILRTEAAVNAVIGRFL